MQSGRVIQIGLIPDRRKQSFESTLLVNSNATLATVASSKSLKGKFPSETNAIPQAMVQKRKTHKMGGLEL